MLRWGGGELRRERCGRGAGRIRGSMASLNTIVRRELCYMVVIEVKLHTGKVVCYFLAKLAAQHRIDVWMRRLWEVGLGKRGHNLLSVLSIPR